MAAAAVWLSVPPPTDDRQGMLHAHCADVLWVYCCLVVVLLSVSAPISTSAPTPAAVTYCNQPNSPAQDCNNPANAGCKNGSICTITTNGYVSGDKRLHYVKRVYLCNHLLECFSELSSHTVVSVEVDMCSL